MKKARKNYSPNEKVAILRRHLIDKVAVADLCDELGLNPNVFYKWQKQFFENGAAAFARDDKRTKNANDRRVRLLQEKLQKKNEVVAELMEEHIQLKKELGEL